MTATHLPKTAAALEPRTSPASVRLLLVVEGVNDWEFLRRISRILHEEDASLPHLAELDDRGELIVIPIGGGRVAAWTHRLAPLQRPEFHLYDHELPPETDYRREAADAINQRDHCRAVLTHKRSLENYLHPRAISAAGNINVEVDDFMSAAEIVAKRLFQSSLDETPWELLSRRARRRMTHRAKQWLNTKVAEQMTADMLRERDPDGEIICWMTTIGRLAGSR